MVAGSVLAVAAAALLAHPAAAEGLYDPVKSHVTTVYTASYDNVVARSNHTTMLEFYAPWCGHCQNLKPAYEKAATSLVGLANVAAVNCDDDVNKPLCAKFEVKGFPTLKIIKPGKKVGKPYVEDYNGPRTAQAIVDIMLEKIPNHVRKIKSADLEKWVHDNKRAKAIVFSDKSAIAPSLKSLAIDFLGIADVAQVSSKEKALVKKFGIKKFPTLIGYPSLEKHKEPRHYDGEMKKFDMAAFMIHLNSPAAQGREGKTKTRKSNFFTAATVDPDPVATPPAENESAQTVSIAAASSSAFISASKSQASAQAQTDAASQTIESLEEQSQPTESPDPKIIPEDSEVPTESSESLPQIPMIEDELALQQKCLNTNAGTCVLAFLPKDLQPSSTGFDAVLNLGRVHQKHVTAQRKLFPFYQLQLASSETANLRKELKLSQDVEIIAINGKRSWFRRYSKTDYSVAALEDWIDSIRMGDGSKDKVPKGLVVDAPSLPKEEPKIDTSDPIAMAEALRSQLPEGVELELEEIDDNEYQRIMQEARKNAPKEDPPTMEKVDHIVDEL